MLQAKYSKVLQVQQSVSKCATELRLAKVTTRTYMKTTDDVSKAIFNKMASEMDWRDKASPLYALALLNQIRFPYMSDLIIRNNKGKNIDPLRPLDGMVILDVGCGVGMISESLARLGARVTGIDMSESAIDRALAHSRKDDELKYKLDYRVGSIESFSASNAQLFDVVVAAHVLNYVTNTQYFLEACCALTKPGGTLIIEAKNRTLTQMAFFFWCRYYMGIKFEKGLIDFSKLHTPQEVKEILAANGIQDFELIGQKFNYIKGTFSHTNSTRFWYTLSGIKKAKSALIH